MKKLKKYLPTILLAIVFFVGLSVLFYPTFSDWWNSRVQSRVVAAYDEAVAGLSEKDYTAYFEAAQAYNERLAAIGSATALSHPELVEGYEGTLDITGTGIIGYVTIDKIDVKLPIYHGTSASVLAVGAGNLEGSSLPIGGESTHSVISAHTGLPSSLLFTHLDRMEVGDVFTITVLNKVIAYQVDQILTVLPTEIENLYIEEEKDYCTLMTCTPYGINTHRLLVRGDRFYPEGEGDEMTTISGEVMRKQWKIPEWAKWAALGIGVLVLIWLLSGILVRIIRAMRKRKKKQNEEEK
ncbi:MAG: class C sortase [Clostridiales bacterium]|nr:class C sortase [Clostridiales bacterium]